MRPMQSTRRTEIKSVGRRSCALAFVLFCFFSVSAVCFGEGIREHLKVGTSNSLDYGGRNVFFNPAAIGFQKSLNGAGLFTSFTYGLNKVRASEFDFSLSYSLLGLGLERLATSAGQFTRFSFATGSQITPKFYSGLRFSFTNSEVTSLTGYNSLDFGLQYRPAKYLSVGLLWEALNQPQMNGSQQPSWVSLSATLRPIAMLDLVADVETPSNSFFQTLNYQFGVNVRILPGLQLHASYHKTNQFQFGVQASLGPAQYEVGSRPGTNDQSILAGVQYAYHKPFQSLWYPPTALKLEINGAIQEEPITASLFRQGRPSFLDVLRQLDKARTNPAVKLVFLDLRSFPLGYGAAEDLWEAIWAVRKAGKHVEAYLGNSGMKEYFIASAANEITINPSATLKFFGPTSSRYYFKGTLDKIGIKAELFAKGKYKSAPESFQKKKASNLSRKETLSRLREAHQILKKFVSLGRKKASADWDRWIEQGVFGAEEAVDQGLVDGLGDAAIAFENTKKRLFVRSNLSEMRETLSLPDRVSVVVASGDILASKSSLISWTGRSQVTPEKFSRHLKSAVADPRTKAIVIRISSPGGSILPSQQIASLIEHARKTKPVFVSMGDVAASGGYMIAAPAEKIFAQELSITGSIGVFLGKINFQGLYKKIDLNKEILGVSPFAGLFSEHRSLTKPEIRLLKKQLDHYYNYFVKYVATRRNLKPEEVEPNAQGRVLLGASALKAKLIDGNKGYLDTIRAAATRGGILEEPLEYRVIRSRGSLFSFLPGGGLIQDPVLKELGASQLVRELVRARGQSGLKYRSPVEGLE